MQARTWVQNLSEMKLSTNTTTLKLSELMVVDGSSTLYKQKFAILVMDKSRVVNGFQWEVNHQELDQDFLQEEAQERFRKCKLLLEDALDQWRLWVTRNSLANSRLTQSKQMANIIRQWPLEDWITTRVIDIPMNLTLEENAYYLLKATMINTLTRLVFHTELDLIAK